MKNHRSAGYSFVALAMVLVVAGVWSSIVVLLLPYMETQGRQRSAEILKRNKAFILGYVMTNKRLPEVGDLPYTTDGQGNTIQYAYDSRLTTAYAICSYQSTYLTVDSLSNVGAVIWSLGPDGVVNPTPTPTKSAGAKSAAVTFVNSVYNKTNSLDDILDWLTLDELKKAAGCDGLASTSTLEIVTDGLPIGRIGSPYNGGTTTAINFTAQGGSGPPYSYSWCVESTALSGVLSGNMSFLSGTVLGSCTPYPTDPTTGSPLVLTPTGTAFDASDLSATGHQIRIFLQDSGAANTISRLFYLFVRGVLDLAQSFSSEFLANTDPQATGDDIYSAKRSKIGSWKATDRFVDNNNGTVADSLTGLVWLKNANCSQFYSGDATSQNNRIWSAALTAANSLANGYCSLSDGSSAGNWRLPSVRELISLLDLGASDPALSSGYPFLNVQRNVDNGLNFVYWSSTSHIELPATAWFVNFYDGKVYNSAKGVNSLYVWPVRDGQTTSMSPSKTGQTVCYDNNGASIACSGTGQDGDLQKGISWPATRFTNNANGTITDNLTGLIWLRNANCTQFYSGDTTGQNNRIWLAALVAAYSLTSGYCGLTDGSVAGRWRLPSYRELESLVDRSQYNSAMPTNYNSSSFFNSTVQSSDYWTGTTNFGLLSGSAYPNAWYVYMYSGLVYDSGITNAKFVWPVREGP
ncbi:MAG: DUF1566 domain-containing protein [Magnetococcales bacterium]|nr:DUF1566 domain-containing protein [Magnetococcales bacterium]